MVGLSLVFLSLFADTLGIGQGSKDNFGTVQWIMLSAGICMVIIALFNRNFSSMIAINLLVLLPMALLIDNLLFLGSPWLPNELVRKLSADAKIKHTIAHWEETPFRNEGGVAFYKPNYICRSLKNKEYVYDEFGYGNPPGYISHHDNIDVILLGASFIEQSLPGSITSNLRQFLCPLTVYSLGIGGQGIPHWGLHFKRYVNSNYFKSGPKVVVLNLYSGHAIDVTLSYKPGTLPYYHDARIKPAPPERKFSLFGELMAILRNELFLEPPPSNLQEEPAADRLSQTLTALSEVVSMIRGATPETVILLSYITTPSAIYGPNVEHCLKIAGENFPGPGFDEHCQFSASRQSANSEILQGWAARFNVHYLDSTPVLRQHAQNITLHNFNDPHFNSEGNCIYSQEIARKVFELIE